MTAFLCLLAAFALVAGWDAKGSSAMIISIIFMRTVLVLGLVAAAVYTWSQR